MFLQSDELAGHIQSVIHKETQLHDDHFDLTISKIYKFVEGGSLDFGGSEFQPAGKQEVEPQKKNQDDKYGWWHLPRGTYQATMNEEVTNLEDTVALLTPHNHTQQVGIVANTTIHWDEEEVYPLTVNFRVPEAGCNIKENARFASLYLLSF